ncbi:tyrosine-type recombinase/integrase [Bifidobacterium olomucense]|uniref:Integrase n=1 Tax=Bifidobacterium olomucense TaxID=2675324 RepID=A0A7Y0EZ81_9BIFI|nr:integrase [Bifidobacterium sp. DSM 109959]
MKKQYPSPLWAESINSWLDSLKAAGYSPNTIGTRRCQMSALSRALEGDPRDVEGDDLLAHFAGKEWKPETRKGAKNACVSYFRWLKVSGRSECDPSEFLPTVKRPEPHPRPCPDMVILAALRKATEGERLMLRLGAECGLRRFEIAKVHSRDVMRDLVGWSLVVVGKGDKQRIVPIGDDLALLIRSAHGYCFPGRWSGHVESSYIGRHLSTLLGDGWTAHSLRHRYATTTYAATHDLLLVSKLLGHASVETTQRYIAMPDDRLRAAVAATRLAA